MQKGTNSLKIVSSLISLILGVWVLYDLGVLADVESYFRSPTTQTMGSLFSIGYWEYLVTKMERVHSLGRGSLAERADGEFVIIFLTATNKDSTASTQPVPKLLDSEGREHSSKMMFSSELPGEDLTIATLNPGVSKTGYFIFDVPSDAFDLKLILSGGMKSGEKAEINLR